MTQQPFDKALIKVGKLVAMMLVDIAQDALGAMLFQLRQRIKLNQLAQLLRHGFAFNHKVVDKPGAVGECERLQQDFCASLFRPACQ